MHCRARSVGVRVTISGAWKIAVYGPLFLLGGFLISLTSILMFLARVLVRIALKGVLEGEDDEIKEEFLAMPNVAFLVKWIRWSETHFWH